MHVQGVAVMVKVVARTKASWTQLLGGDGDGNGGGGDSTLGEQYVALVETCDSLRSQWQGVAPKKLKKVCV
jgi:hypothetical protein